MNASILAIGNELLSGLVVNTNASFIAQQLDSLGIIVSRIDTVSDSKVPISEALDYHLQQSDLVIITGGLGPTNDDITKQTLAEKFGMNLEFHAPTYAHIQQLFSNRGIAVSDTNRMQAMLPKGCTVLANAQGTAPGMWFEMHSKIVISLPGVPFEMEYLIKNEVIPRLKKITPDTIILRKLILTTGIAESNLQDMLASWESKLDASTQLAYLPQPGIVKLRISISDKNEEIATQKLSLYETQLHEILGSSIFGVNDDTLEEIIGKQLSLLQKTISVAESCTGGYISHLITSIPGSSEYFKGGIVSYANDIKASVLNVDPMLISKHGAVSKQVVSEMAQNILKIMDTDFAIATSGIAGPTGGTIEKPVGTVWIAIADKNSVIATKYNFGKHRGRTIRRTALTALDELRKILDCNN